MKIKHLSIKSYFVYIHKKGNEKAIDASILTAQNQDDIKFYQADHLDELAKDIEKFAYPQDGGGKNVA